MFNGGHSRRESMQGHHRRESLQSQTSNTTAVKVLVRIRPEIGSARPGARFQRTVVHPANATTLQIDNAAAQASTPSKSAGKNIYTFDRVIRPDEGQLSVYEEVEPLVESFLQGHNVTVLAYGQTSSGKSYTMGTDQTSSIGDDEFSRDDRLGITPRAIAEIFRRLDEAQAESKSMTTYRVKLSYVELHNEDLIDLLAGDHDARPLVQIREDPNGKIIWSGLREVTVNNVAEVMNYLTAGSALRQTNATDMNAQSSRSHAIFSLTLEQRKYTGSGSPPAASHSRKISRSSMLPRINSPTPSSPSRSSTPTGDRVSGRASGLRPPSVLGRPSTPDEDRIGSDTWTAITSKFHFVDLAGSERLKRTAAAGERVKEGISINSGLHALGNVISALADPAKKATHIPYRDSKLTRLLQDSLGGNSKTIMIACVSPTELNLHESISTVQYASRARKIKNRAEINEVEVGWDDVEYLQRTITKLRAELAGLKNGDAVALEPIDETSRSGTDSGDMGSRYTELQRKHAQLTAELATAQTGLAGITATSLTREEFAAAIEPVVEEYEKSLSALESQLSLTKAALGHSEDEMKGLEIRVEEEVKANEANGALIDELKGRISKLGEREATVEAYVRDLEAKLKDYGDQDQAHGIAVSDLRKEITKNREQSEKTEQYIVELEARLVKTDEVNAALRQRIEVLERDVQRREESYRELETRLSVFDSSADHKLLLAEIDEKERRLLNLERSLDETKVKASSAATEQQRLQKLADEEREAKEELQSRVRTLERASIIASPEKSRHENMTPPRTLGDDAATTADDAIEPEADVETDAAGRNSVVITALEHELSVLQQKHEETLDALETANAKYRESLHEIADLNQQVNDAKLRSPVAESLPPTPSVESKTTQDRVASGATEDDEVDRLPTSPSRGARTPRTRRSMPLAPQHRLSFLGRGQGAPAHSHARAASLSQELSLAVSLQEASSPTSPRLSSPVAQASINRESIYGNLSSPQTARSYEQMKEEVMKLQSALDDREEEITLLQASLQHQRSPSMSSTSPQASPLAQRVRHVRSRSNVPSDQASPLKERRSFENDENVPTQSRQEELMRAMANKESEHQEVVRSLEVDVLSLRRQLEARKQDDQVHTVTVDSLKSQHADDLRLAEERHLSEVRKLQSEHEADLQSFRQEAQITQNRIMGEMMEAGKAWETERLSLVHKQNELEQKLKTMILDSTTHEDEHVQVLAEARKGHEESLQSQTSTHATSLATLAQQHVDASAAIRSEYLEELESTKREHASALANLVATHEAELLEAKRTVNDRLQAQTVSHTSSLDNIRQEHSSTLDELQNDHTSTLEDLRRDHAAESQKVSSSRDILQRRLDSSEDRHSKALRDQQQEHEHVVAELATRHEQALEEIRATHNGVVEDIKTQHARSLEHGSMQYHAELERTKAEHETAILALQEAHTTALTEAADQLHEAKEGHETFMELTRAEHLSSMAKLKEEHVTALKEATSELVSKLSETEQQKATAVEISKQLENDIRDSEREHSAKVEELQRTARLEQAASAQLHEDEIKRVEQKHEADLKETEERLVSETEERLRRLAEDHTVVLEALQAEHFESAASTTQQRVIVLEAAQAEHQRTLEEARTSHESALESAKSAHREELERLDCERQSTHTQHLALMRSHEASMVELEMVKEAKQRSFAAHEDLQHEYSLLKVSHIEAQEEHERGAIELRTIMTNHKSTIAGLEKALEEAQDQIQLSRDEITARQADLQRSQDVHASTLQTLRSAEDSLSKSREEHSLALEELQTSKMQIETQLAHLSQERNDLEAELERAKVDLQAALSSGKCKEEENTRSSPTSQRSVALTFSSGKQLPPPTPPPSMPPPPVPSHVTPTKSTTRRVSNTSTVLGSQDHSVASDSTLTEARLSRKLEEHEAQITRLMKQLTHCEADLQANMDLVATLESALDDAERGLRQVTRERDSYMSQNEALQKTIENKQREVVTVRPSVSNAETRLQEERAAIKERAKAELQKRLDAADAVANRRRSKCWNSLEELAS